jgi:Fe2+ or Zn2+ uptake regulation protein
MAVTEAMEPYPSPNCDAVLREAILDYLEENPDAMESVPAIAEWWIARSQIRVGVEALKRVLKELTDEGILKEIQISGETYCRLAKET